MKYPSSYFHWNPDLRSYQCECGNVVHSAGARWQHVTRSKRHAGRVE